MIVISHMLPKEGLNVVAQSMFRMDYFYDGLGDNAYLWALWKLKWKGNVSRSQKSVMSSFIH